MDFGFWAVFARGSEKIRAGRRKKKREVVTTEKPAKFVINIDIKEHKIAKDWREKIFFKKINIIEIIRKK